MTDENGAKSGPEADEENPEIRLLGGERARAAKRTCASCALWFAGWMLFVAYFMFHKKPLLFVGIPLCVIGFAGGAYFGACMIVQSLKYMREMSEKRRKKQL
ncbi:MAG: hypothetical protein ACYS8W_17890 [Planctomycetota bacterium]|jgi:hypothetical protein